MSKRPFNERCRQCGEELITVGGFNANFPGYMLEAWPAWGGSYDDVMGPVHIDCLRQSGRSQAATECYRRFAIEAGHAHEVYSDENLFVAHRRTGARIVLDGIYFEIRAGEIDQAARSGQYLDKYMTSYDLLGKPRAMATELEAALATGSPSLETVYRIVGLAWRGLPEPVEAITLGTYPKETPKGFRHDELVVETYSRYRLDPPVPELLADLDHSLFDYF